MQDAEEIASTILENESQIDPETCKAVWPRLARSGRLTPDCDVVTVVGTKVTRGRWFPSEETRWSEEERVRGWRAPRIVELPAGGEGGMDSYDAFISEAGNSWLRRTWSKHDSLFMYDPTRSVHRVFVPIGDHLVVRNDGPPYSDEGEVADLVTPVEAYVRCVASVLGAADQPPLRLSWT